MPRRNLPGKAVSSPYTELHAFKVNPKISDKTVARLGGLPAVSHSRTSLGVRFGLPLAPQDRPTPGGGAAGGGSRPRPASPPLSRPSLSPAHDNT